MSVSHFSFLLILPANAPSRFPLVYIYMIEPGLLTLRLYTFRPQPVLYQMIIHACFLLLLIHKYSTNVFLPIS